MNLPNKLTVIRVCLIPFFVVLLLGSSLEWEWFNALFGSAAEYMRYAALAIFIAASLTDLADGRISRRYHLITNFGKFMDPLADKILVGAAFICFVEMELLPAWYVIVIISREFIISGFRLIASDNGIVIAAGYWGKFKTTSQMLLIILLILNIPELEILTTILYWTALILTIVSMIDYIARNFQVLSAGGF